MCIPAVEHQHLYDKLEAAFDSRNQEQLEPAINQYKEGVPRKRDQDELLAKAERLLEMIKCSAGSRLLHNCTALYSGVGSCEASVVFFAWPFVVTLWS